MARAVYFSFHYERDIWRVNVVRNDGAIEGVSAAGFRDTNEWESAVRAGAGAAKGLVDRGLAGSTVTAVLIGAETADREWVSYEIEQSIARRNGILGIRIHRIKDQHGRVDPPGTIPDGLTRVGADIHDWEYGKLSEWVEQAYRKNHSWP